VAVVIKVKDLNNHPPKKAVYDFCHDHIAFYKIPKFVKFVTDYPLTVSGKVQKFIIRKELEEESKSGKINEYRIK
jgi:acyl-CoA synthetase (AMP-forming)/AMP-acid ligase II